jgi:hypothetical protein
MPHPHLPHLDDEDEQREPQSHPEDAGAADSAPAKPHRAWTWKSLTKIGLEVVLISAGVFLGLAGEQWRENRHHQELAAASLLRFQAEFLANRAEVLRVKDRHGAELKGLLAYFNTHQQELTAHLKDVTKPIPTPLPDTVTDSAGVDFGAWDFALATQSLVYLDPDLVASMSSAYRFQQIYLDAHRAIQQTAYSHTDPVYYLRGLISYFDDASLYEELLLKRYDEILLRLDKAVAAQ